ncbi:MAG: hypothetical protein KDD58_16340, partial [Bdellovibrionales bacterium]|nr:hypothetical protein [Bdellovibrionales bacterium]
VKKPSGTIVENTDFWSGSNLESPVNEFADGMSAAGLTVFTGSGGFGNYSFDSCSDWSSTGSAGSYGSTDAVNFDWIDLGFATCNTTRHWYCIGPGN